jgi:hypothetical protein
MSQMNDLALPILLFLAVTAALFFVAVFQLLWNMTMPETFGLKPIRFWVAFRLLLISAFLTSGFWLKFH